MTGVAEGYLDPLQRHAHGLGCRLRDDRVGAGANVGHVGLHNHPALAVKPDPRRRLHCRCAAIARRHAHADQPVPFPDLRRPGVALVPVEALRAFAQAAHQVAVGELLGRIAGYHLGLVEDAERDRVEAQLLGHFVHRHFQRHVARCFARCAHRIAFGHVERGDVIGHQAVGACIELGRLQGAVLAVLAVDVARPVLMGDGGDPAILSAADPHALEGGVPVRGVVGHQRALQCDLHRPPDLLGRQRGQHRVGTDEQLAAEAAADIGRVHAHLGRIDAEDRRHALPGPVDHLVRRP